MPGRPASIGGSAANARRAENKFMPAAATPTAATPFKNWRLDLKCACDCLSRQSLHIRIPPMVLCDYALGRIFPRHIQRRSTFGWRAARRLILPDVASSVKMNAAPVSAWHDRTVAIFGHVISIRPVCNEREWDRSTHPDMMTKPQLILLPGDVSTKGGSQRLAHRLNGG